VHGLTDLDAMFALAFYDQAAETLTLARDRYGEKPLFYAFGHHRGQPWFCAGSDLRQFRGLDTLSGRINPQAAGLFLNYGICERGADTFIEGVYRLGAGQALTLDLSHPSRLAASFPPQTQTLPQTQTWVRAHGGALGAVLTPAEAASEARARLSQSVRNRLVSTDVAYGACLSGGLDSSLIVALMSELAPRPPECISAIFEDADEPEISERPYVEALQAHLGLTVHTISPSARDVALALDGILDAQGEPFPNTSICAQWFVFKAARDHGLKVMLDGQGADELMGGYPGMLGHWLKSRLRAGGPMGLWGDLAALSADASGETHAGLLRALMRAQVPEALRRQVLSHLGRWPPHALLYPQVVPPPEPDMDFADLCQRLVSVTSLPALLRFEDRNAMDHGVESRLPFLNADFSLWALSLDPALRIAGGWRKAVLRAASAGLVPAHITDRRRKLGFNSPHRSWMRAEVGAVCRDWIAQYRHGAACAPIPQARIDQALEDPQQGFRLAVYLKWADQFSLSL
jgi:asparagine synthase (glutamine-hydrolysing)